ncbi:MoaD/ThiS family protein [Candidatus Woesearchaeota archaeon]|nr:MoaD/ThiS family protein [Candidatus Woesearchaeota archaeon]
MKITVKNERDNFLQTVKLSGKTVKDLLIQIKINPETVIVVRNEEVIAESELLQDKDHLDLLSVISGG